MNKQEFLFKLNNGLSSLSKDEVAERINFYSEMIDDRIEEGLTEENAVAEVGTIDDIINQILAESHSTAELNNTNDISSDKRKIKAWEIVLLVLGSPIWLSLLVALFAVIFSVYVSLWSIIIALWSVFVSLIACSLYGVVSGVIFAFSGLTGVAILSLGVVCAGLSIFAFYGCKCATVGIVKITKNITKWIIRRFSKKEVA